MPLFEKAYSKFIGNYDRIEWGLGYESLRQLSNMPVYYINHRKMASKDAQMFSIFQKLHDGNHPMVTACCDVKG